MNYLFTECNRFVPHKLSTLNKCDTVAIVNKLRYNCNMKVYEKIDKKTPIIILLTFLAISSFIALFFLPWENTKRPKANKIKVTTTIFTVYDFAGKVGKDKAEVVLILPQGAEPHAFEPKPDDIKRIIESDVFFYVSDEMEPWVSKIKNEKSKAMFVNLSKGIKQRNTNNEESEENMDPHYWLDLGNARLMTNEISKVFISADPKNSDYFKSNSEILKNNLDKIDNEFAITLKTCKTKSVYHAGHFAFGYLADRYGLTYQAIQGYSPESDAKAQDVASFINQINLQEIKTVYFEELIDPKVAKIIASETGAKTLVLNAAHTVSKKESESGISYSDIMISNLANLRIGLGCK